MLQDETKKNIERQTEIVDRYAFKVYYQGNRFSGYQRQPSGRGVENFIELAFIKAGYIDAFGENHYKSTSRTDAGVHAIGNVFTLDMDGPAQLTRLNNCLPKGMPIVIWSQAPVKSDFHPRSKTRKLYHYYVPDKWNRVNLEALYDFVGQHNFSNFIKSEGAGQHDPYCTIFDLEIAAAKHGNIVKIWGDNFGREQIRRMVGYVLYKQHNEVSIKSALQRTDVKTRPAPAEFLCLQQIEFGEQLAWENDVKLEFKLRTIQKSVDQTFMKLNHLKYINELLESYFTAPK